MPKRVLIIDDSEIVLGVVEEALTDAGYEVQALLEPQMIGDAPPDLILIDINMPQVFGDDAARWFKEIKNVEAPIYLFSDAAETELKERVEKSGADGYISKSWGIEELVNIVGELLKD